MRAQEFLSPGEDQMLKEHKSERFVLSIQFLKQVGIEN